ncbi:MAG: cytochrome C oxidase subunit IV family protein [Sphingobacteriales bacterium]|nr:MAG: cytochrome C oxidase subunit IV family protein [Sphingobacteriales bacterium]
MAHTYDAQVYKSQVNAVYRATVWLAIITIIEVAAALVWMNIFKDHSGPRLLLNSFFIAASLLKAYFIVGEFMHIRYETRALTITILAPTFFLIWFIIAFLWEGQEWLNNKTDGQFIQEEIRAPHHHDDDHGSHDSQEHKDAGH